MSARRRIFSRLSRYDFARRINTQLRAPSSRRITAALLAAAGLLALLLVFWIGLVVSLPSNEELRNARTEEATVVFAADGTELTRYQDKNRRWVTLEEISPHVTEALIATEDHRFYDHWGVDVLRTAGSVLKTLGGDTQGGSTITMQLVRNAYPEIGDDWMLQRKVKEWITALRLEAMFTKDEILEMYLNTVPFMYNAFGIEAAAQTYFQKTASELDEGEAATLVGMLKGTVYYNPVRHPERSLERRNVVLQQMVKRGYLDEGTYEEMAEVPTALDFKRMTRADELAPHFAEYLRAWLDEWAEDRGYNLYTDGLRIYSTIDPTLQKAAQTAVDEMGDQLQAVADVEWSRASVPFTSGNGEAYVRYRENVSAFDYFWERNGELLDRFIQDTDEFRALREQGLSEGAALDTLRSDAEFMDSLKTAKQRLQAGFVAVEPSTGHVRAWVGGRGFGDAYYDHVAQARRQPGSTFKPFVYAAALEEGFSPADRLMDEPIEIVDPDTKRRWKPKNVGGISGEAFTLSEALAYSKNTITAQLMQHVGPKRVVDIAHRMGIESELEAYPSLALGTSEVSLLELVGAYTPLANNGRYQEPIFVTRIEDADGRLLARFSSESREAISPETAYSVLDMMRGVVDFGTGVRIRYRYGARGDLAGKTGTTQNGADGWFMLLHPNLIIGSWVGFPVPAITFRSSYWGQGSHTALEIVGRVIREVELPDASFHAPPGYRPPARRDTTLFAVETQYDDSEYLDSLEARTDSLLDIFEDPWSSDEEASEESPESPPVRRTGRPSAPRPLPENDLELGEELDPEAGGSTGGAEETPPESAGEPPESGEEGTRPESGGGGTPPTGGGGEGGGAGEGEEPPAEGASEEASPPADTAGAPLRW